MIMFYCGLPGSGKSYEAVRLIIDNLRLGRVVCTNIDGMDNETNQEYIKNLANLSEYDFRRNFVFLTKADVLQFWKTKKEVVENDIDGKLIRFERESPVCPLGSMIVIDEAHLHFNSRDFQNKENRSLADWASTHRHHGYDVVFITQNIDKVEKQVRTLTQWTYLFRKVDFLGAAVKKKYMRYAYSGDDHSGPPLSKNVRTYEAKYFPCYQSHASSDVKELGIMKHVNILKHPIFFAIPVVLCFCIYMFSKSSFASGDLFGTKKRLADAGAKIERQRAASSVPAPIAAPPLQAVQRPVSSASFAPSMPAFRPVSSSAVPVQSMAQAPDARRVVGVISCGSSRKYLLSTGQIVSSRQSFSIGDSYL